MLKSKAAVTAPSEWLVDFYKGRGFFPGQKLAVVHNPTPKKTDGKLRDERAASIFLCVGQLEQYKGLHVILNAAAALPKNDQWRLDIVGAGPMFDELRRRRDQNIRLRGRLEGEELAAAFREATVLIMPSLCEENSPMVVVEAQAYGLPVIASNVGGVSEMVKDGQTGVLVRAGSVDDLALAMRRAIEHPEIFSAMRPAIVKEAEKHDPKSVAAEYLKLFNE
jgi:glycosyltransferase involved in cell wall biosynthesis